VRHQEDGHLGALVDLLDEVHDGAAAGAVEVARRLGGEDEGLQAA